jgi:hypothetical protein
MDRHVWTDERIDDMVDRLDTNIGLLREEISEMRAEMRAEFAVMDDRMRAGFAASDARFTAMNERMVDGFTSLRRDMLYAVLGLSTVFIAALATLLANTL